MKSKILTLLAVGLLWGPIAVRAAMITYPPPANGNSQNVAANDPANGNVWTGLGQSFTAEDPAVLFGFHVGNFTGSSINQSLLLTLYAGNGVFNNALGQVSATVSLASFAKGFVQVDFSSIPLALGQFYTVVASLPTGLPVLGTRSSISLLYSDTMTNPYAGGRFWFTGSSYNQLLPAFANRDLAFTVTPVAPVPEPGSVALLGLGLAGLGLSRRRKG